MITEATVKLLPILDEIKPGDIIETVEVHEYTLPELGMIFSPYEVVTTAYNITFRFILPFADSLHYKVYNSPVVPDISRTEESKTYSFHWQHYKRPKRRNVFSFRNTYPQILAKKFLSNKPDTQP